MEASCLLSGRDLQRLHRWVVDSLSNAVAEILVHSGKDRDYNCMPVSDDYTWDSRDILTLPLLDGGALDVAEVNGDIVHEVLLLGVVEDLLPKGTRLLEVD